MHTCGMPKTTVPTIVDRRQRSGRGANPAFIWAPSGPLRQSTFCRWGEDQVPRRGEAPSVRGLRYTIKFGYAIYPMKWTTEVIANASAP
jgi:hypothetical protein